MLLLMLIFHIIHLKLHPKSNKNSEILNILFLQMCNFLSILLQQLLLPLEWLFDVHSFSILQNRSDNHILNFYGKNWYNLILILSYIYFTCIKG